MREFQKTLSALKLRNIDNIKVLMMLLVVLYHSCVFFTGSWFSVENPVYEAPYIAFFSKWLNSFHVNAFTMASGYTFYYLWKVKNRYTMPNEDIKKRFGRLIVPFFVTTITWAIPFDMLFYKTNNTTLFINYFLGKSPSQLWFLLMLFWVFIAFYFLKDKLVISWSGLFVSAIFAVCLSTLIGVAGLNYFQIGTAISYFPYYYLGAMLCHKNFTLEKRQSIIIIFISIISYLFLASINNNLDNSWVVVKLVVKLMNMSVSILEVIVIYYLVTIVTYMQKREFMIIWRERFRNILSQSSFGIYLFHQQIIYITIIMLNGKVNPMIQVICSFFISLVSSILLVCVLRKIPVCKKLYGL